MILPDNTTSSFYKPTAFAGYIGVAQRDITPPAGIYARNWGAAQHDAAEGIHRPLMLTCITFHGQNDGSPLLLLSADFGVWRSAADGKRIRDRILQEWNLPPSRLMFCLTHTHAGPVLSRENAAKQGGEFIDEYLLLLEQKAVAVVKQALASASPAVLTWQYGTCALAASRDLPDKDGNRFVVGYNPTREADTTLLVGRITDAENKVIGTIVNYACHPTTLAWENKLISPDYVGAMRELVQDTVDAPCLFLQGASGELAPAEQYTGDTTLADKHGRQLGHCVLATLESMLPPAMGLTFNGVVESGAPLAVWRQRAFAPSSILEAKEVKVTLDLKDLPSLEAIDLQYATCTDRVIQERLLRKRALRLNFGNGDQTAVSVWVWRLGDSLLVGQPNEAYSIFQQALRSMFSSQAIAVINLVNGSAGYLPPKELYEQTIYSVWQTPFANGSLEKLLQIAITTCMELNSID